MLSKIKLPEGSLRKIELDVRIETKESVSPHRTIDWQPVGTYQELTICASIYRRDGRTAPWRDSAFGQCREEIRGYVRSLRAAPERFQTPEQEARCVALEELVTIWERWHLNGMNSGLRGQRDALMRRAEQDPGVLEYSAACKYLEIEGLHPHPFMGYHYGSAWLVELLPDAVAARVRQLCETLGAKVLEAA